MHDAVLRALKNHAYVQAMGAVYLQERPEIASSLLAMAQALNFSVRLLHLQHSLHITSGTDPCSYGDIIFNHSCRACSN